MTMHALEQIQDDQSATTQPSKARRAREQLLRWSTRRTVPFVVSISTLLWAVIIWVLST